jgi:uncharacterized protein YbaR (Trm112 family)
MEQNLICPRCKQETLDPIKHHNALSRKDNKTIICSDCGTMEALEDAGLLFESIRKHKSDGSVD